LRSTAKFILSQGLAKGLKERRKKEERGMVNGETDRGNKKIGRG
jgi:hypothetical protein